jgi:predicted membrane-bound spermidine synthase
LATFSIFGGLGGVIIPAAFGILSSLSFGFRRHKILNLFGVLLLLLFVFLLLSSPHFMMINISPYKELITALRYPGSRLLDTKWNSFSRIDIVDSPAVRFAPGLSLRYLKPIPYQMGIAVDGENLNAMTRFDGRKEGIQFTSFLPSAVAFYLRNIRDVLVLEPMGGLDVLMSIYHGARSITGVEINPLIVNALKREYREFVGNIYHDERVKIRIEGGRGYLRSTDKRFDLIQVSISNTLGASSTGIYGMSEDYVFTEEAFIDYYNHLNENGFLSITKYLLPPPRTELRIVSVILSSLERMGIKSPERHIAIIRSWGTITFLLKHNIISHEEMLNLKEFCTKRRFDLVYYPGIKREEVNVFNKFKEPIYYNLISQIIDKSKREELYQRYLFNVRSVTDDMPFFYHFFRWDRLKELYLSMGKKWQPFVEGAYLVPVVLVQAIFLSIILIILPVFLKRRKKEKKYLQKGRWLFLLYFFLIGMGFMFIEISLIQKFILFLGHPAYAISMVLFAILVSSGAGSYLSRWLVKTGIFCVDWIILILAGMILFYTMVLPYVSTLVLGGNIFLRQAYTLFLLMPLGILMGMPFPIGIGILNKYSRSIIPWAWCVNGCSSVLSSITAVIVALSWGFTGVLICSAGAYLIGLICIKGGMR